MFKNKKMIGLIVAAFVATIAFSHGRESHAADRRNVVIEIENFEFAPNAPILKRGDVIVWINKDIVPHTVTANNGSWESGPIESGGEWRMVVETDLFEAYQCGYHPSMIGRLAIAVSPSKISDRRHAADDLSTHQELHGNSTLRRPRPNRSAATMPTSSTVSTSPIPRDPWQWAYPPMGE